MVIDTNSDGLPRFCEDYRALKRRMNGDRFPMPMVDEIIDDEPRYAFSEAGNVSWVLEDQVGLTCEG